VQVHDDRDAIQSSPDDLPVIDIRSICMFHPAGGFEAGLHAG